MMGQARIFRIAVWLVLVALAAAACSTADEPGAADAPATADAAAGTPDEPADAATEEADAATDDATDDADATADAGAEGDPIPVGAIFSLSGPAAPFGTPQQNAAQVAAARINEEGGVLGRPLELVFHDDTTDPTAAARGATDLIEQGVVAIIGASTSSGTLAMQPVAARAEVPIIATGGAREITDPGAEAYPWTFRVAPSDTDMIPLILERAIAEGHERVAIFSQEDAWGEFGRERYVELAEENPEIEIVESVAAALDATDVTPQAVRIRDAEPDAVILQVSSVGLGSAFLRAAADSGLDVPMLAGIGLAQQALIEAAGPAADRLLTLNNVVPTDPTDRQQELYDMIIDAGNEPAYGFADIIAGDAVEVIAAAIEEAGSTEPEAIKEALASGLEIEGYSSAPINFSEDDRDGLPAEAYVWTTVEDGEWVPAPTE